MSFYQYTGNPFVDAGISAIVEWTGRRSPEEIIREDLESMIQEIIPIYLSEGWKKSFQSIFPNSVYINPGYKDNRQEVVQNFFKILIEGVRELGTAGTCIACGCRSASLLAKGKLPTKTHVPLTGSGELRNYFSYAGEGEQYCVTCVLAIQFCPLVLQACGKLLLLHTNSAKVLRYWAKKCITQVRTQVASGNLSGCVSQNFTRSQNALLYLTQDLIMSYDERWTDEWVTLRIYHFTNYNQGPDLDIYELPTSVFRFLAYVKRGNFYRDWVQIYRRGFKGIKELKQNEEEYKNNFNEVFQKLLNGESIVSYFLSKNRKILGNWELMTYYLREVEHMSDERINTIKRVGDEIAAFIRQKNDLKRLGQLERADSYRYLRNILRLIIKERAIKMQAERPLFTLDEYVEYLFPEGERSWRETQDLLLFRIYEQLHDWFKEHAEVESIDIEVGETERVLDQ